MPKPLIIAHRGDSSRAVENSLEAFHLALSVPVDMIEFDIRKSRNNVLYVMHDRDTGRTANANIDIEKAVSDDISRLRLNNGEVIPTLNDVLTLVDGKAGLNIEIKSEGAGALAAAHMAGSGYRGQVLISSFKELEVVDARRTAPTIPVAGIFDRFILSEVASYRLKGYDVVSINKKTASRDLIERFHQMNIRVYVWTVDDEAEVRELISWGVDGIYSNKPCELRRMVG